ncbi:MAG: PAS domain S-box protein [Flavobacteriales bacterium]|nr:PAS domain S-box protein [Flavobacteriales bacterium]
MTNNFSQLFDGSTEGILITTESGEIIYFNDRIFKQAPNLPKQPIKSDFENFINFDASPNSEVSFDLFELNYLIIVNKKSIELEGITFFLYRLKTKDKDPVEERLSFFINNIDEIIYTEKIFKEHGARLSFISNGIEKITGASIQEIEQNNKLPHHYAIESDQKHINGVINSVNATLNSGKCQFRIKNTTNKKITWVELSLYPQVSPEGLHYANFGIIRDISKNIEADQLLRQSELKHRLLFSEANDAIMIFKGMNMVDCNEKTLSMFKSPSYVEIAKKKLHELMPEKQPNGEDSLLKYHYYIQQALKGVSQFFYWKHSNVNGTQFDSEVSINSFTVEADVFLQIIVRDITLRKIAEEQKNQSIKSYFEIFNSSSDLIFIVNNQGKVIDVNQSVLNEYDSPKPEIIGVAFDQLGYLQIDKDDDFQKIGKTWSGEQQKFNWLCKTKNGKKIPLEMILHHGTYFGKEVIIANGRDISERLDYENTLKESEARFRTLASHAPIGIFLTNQKGDVVYVNDKLKELSLYPSFDGFMNNWLSKVHDNDKERVLKQINLKEQENNQQYEYRIIPKKGDEKWVKVQVNLLKSLSGEIIGRVGTVEDITKKIQSAKLLKDSEKNYRKLVEILPDSIILHNERSIEYLNPKAQSFLQISIGASISTLISSGRKDQIRIAISEAINGKQSPFFESQIKTGDRVTDIEICAVPFTYNQQPVAKLVIHDITSRKRAEKEKLRAEFAEKTTKHLKKEIDEKTAAEEDLKQAEENLKENIHQKEVLLKEVHHRVKNNLQVISSILNLQRGYIQDEGTLNIVRECQDRIKSMAFIHENLYQSVDLAEINFPEYLQNLCNNLKYSYMTPDRNISLDFDFEDISLSLDSAIPCGLIVNELVSNCFKYAFKDSKRGDIKISLAKKNNKTILIVHDSGIGLPKDLNIETNDSLGLQLVLTLVDQIDGKIKYEYTNGSKFTINFKRN